MHGRCKRRKISLKDWLQHSKSSESSESLQGLSLFVSYSAPTTSAASRLMSKQKFADANDLGDDDRKQDGCMLVCEHVWGQEKML